MRDAAACGAGRPEAALAAAAAGAGAAAGARVRVATGAAIGASTRKGGCLFMETHELADDIFR